MEYQIGEFSKISRMSIKTLRYYHESGLLVPVRIDNLTGYRYYNEKSLETAEVINILKNFEFSIKEIKDIIDNFTDDEDLTDVIQKKRMEIERKISHYQDVESKITRFIKEKNARYNNAGREDISVKKIPEILIASIRYKGKYDEIGRYLSVLYKEFGRYITGKPFNLYYDQEFMEDDADIETCVHLEKYADSSHIKSELLSGGSAVSILHKGPYETLGQSYKKIFDFMQSSKIIARSPSREIYLKGPGTVFRRSPKDFITEIQFLINEK